MIVIPWRNGLMYRICHILLLCFRCFRFCFDTNFHINVFILATSLIIERIKFMCCMESTLMDGSVCVIRVGNDEIPRLGEHRTNHGKLRTNILRNDSKWITISAEWGNRETAYHDKWFRPSIKIKFIVSPCEFILFNTHDKGRKGSLEIFKVRLAFLGKTMKKLFIFE